MIEELQQRGLVVQISNKEKLSEILENEKITLYVGIDPTGNCPHIGHLVQFKTLSKLQKMGHRVILLFGGATAMIGDPSGKSDIRKMLSREEISENIQGFKTQSARFLDVKNLIIVNNADWLNQLNYIEFLREIGTCFSVNKMLSCECYKSRLEQGLTFFEMNYMVLQSYDYLHLFDTFGCTLEFGGNDQWSNILGGVDLIRRKRKTEVFGMTSALLTKSDGQKMGKTEKGALWLDPERVSPYDFYQYFRNIDDKSVITCFKMLTDITLEEISHFEKIQGREINKLKEILAFEITKTVHGKTEAERAKSAANSVFYSESTDEMPVAKLLKNDFVDNKIDVITLLMKTGFTESRSEAKRIIEQGGLRICGEKVVDIKKTFEFNDFVKNNGKSEFVIQKGKKVYKKIKVN